MYLGCSSQSYDDVLKTGDLSLQDWFRLAADELGVRAVELEDKHIGEPTDSRIDELRAAAARCGVEIVNIALMNNFGVASAARREAEEARTIQWVGVARRLGARHLRTFAGWPEGDRAARWQGMLAALRAVCAHAAAAEIPLVMENHNHGGFVQTAQDVERILAGVGAPILGLLLDTGNYLDGLASVRRTAALARHVHVKCTRIGPDGRDETVDNGAALRALRDAGYAGCAAVEYEGEEASRTAVPRAVAYLRTQLGPAPTRGPGQRGHRDEAC
jgi:L-ribulose-5-phosphate 3-epimerase